MTPRIEVAGLTHEFRSRGRTPTVALSGVDLAVGAGEFLVVVGPSGCGKTTLLDVVAGLTTPTRGEVRIDGEPVRGPGLDRGIVFQQYALFPWRTAQQNVELSLEEAGGHSRRERARLAREQLDRVGLVGFEDRYPHQLSGGMKQRVAIARSLVHGPRILLMDEPFAALDAQTREGLQAELRRLWRESGTTVVFITHGIDEAVYLGQRVAVMSPRPGRISDVVDVDLPDHVWAAGVDTRSAPEFAAHRRHIWTLLHGGTAGEVAA
ncbi:ABC transporter ATP-binding protein [Pseudonocardia ailaonensis]|uniref:ABC transporter ATP-binding protein n=1 Tax=Pseudonocardia ailaonensis TaxID=367279 RepID=A0ABN2MK64_9PSEU